MACLSSLLLPKSFPQSPGHLYNNTDLGRATLTGTGAGAARLELA
jgi:hypothetical protein